MEHNLQEFFDTTALLQIMALLVGALFFAMAGLRELKNERPEGYFFLTLSVFFLMAHGYCICNLPPDLSVIPVSGGLGIWQWLVNLLAPALIILLLVFGLFSLLMTRLWEGLVKIFFGLTLLCYLYMLGGSWPIDMRGILTVIYGSVWFHIELGTAC